MIKRSQPPYHNTKVDPDQTRVEIDKLLRKYGVQKIIWASDYERSDVQLGFEIDTEIQGVHKVFTVIIKPPVIYKRAWIWNPKRYKNELNRVPNWPAAMRMMLNYIKGKIEAISYGLVSVEQEFLSQIMVSLPQGSSTFGQVIEPMILRDRLSDIPALEQRKTPEGRAIDGQ